MVKKTDERKDINEENKDIFKTWEDSYTAISKMWEDSYLKLYKPWLETTGEQFEKMVELSTDASPEKYKEFYDVWVKTCQNSSSKFTQIPTLESSKETFEKLMISAEESNKIYRSWVAQMEDNSRVTHEVLQVEPGIGSHDETFCKICRTFQRRCQTRSL